MVNGTGLTQTAVDFPLMLSTSHTTANLANGGKAGVKIMGAYKLDVGGISLSDTADGRAPANDKRWGRRRLPARDGSHVYNIRRSPRARGTCHCPLMQVGAAPHERRIAPPLCL